MFDIHILRASVESYAKSRGGMLSLHLNDLNQVVLIMCGNDFDTSVILSVL